LVSKRLPRMMISLPSGSNRRRMASAERAVCSFDVTTISQFHWRAVAT
jgi:hypothetical protein